MENLQIEDNGKSLRLICSQTGITMASLVYSIEKNPVRHLYIHCAASREKQKGYYGILFRETERIAKSNGCESIRAKTGSTSGYRGVVEMQQKYGFKSLPQTEMDIRRGRIGMEKLL